MSQDYPKWYVDLADIRNELYTAAQAANVLGLEHLNKKLDRLAGLCNRVNSKVWEELEKANA